MFFNKTLFIFIFKELKRIKTTFEKMSKVFNLNNISDLFILVQNLTKSSECNIDESFDCVQDSFKGSARDTNIRIRNVFDLV